MQKNKPKTKKLDNLSIWLSGICMMHCLALPLITISVPLISEIFNTHYHEIMLFIVIPISSIALFKGFKYHRKAQIVFTGFFGAFLIIIGATVIHDQYDGFTESLFTITGSLLLALTHFINSRNSHHNHKACQ
jgi:hypothetical protein